MRRDVAPSLGEAEIMMMELLGMAQRTVAGQPSGTAAADAAAAVRAEVEPVWSHVVPEAARDVMIAAAQLAVGRGVAELPADVAERYGARAVVAAVDMIDLTREWVAAGEPRAPGGFPPPVALASSVAFDRDEDDWTLTSVAVLLALAHLGSR